MHSDRKIIIISLAIAIVCIIPFYSTELQEIWAVNRILIASVPLAVALLMILIPILMAYSIKLNDQGYFMEVQAKKNLKCLKKKQVIHVGAKVRSHPTGAEWSIRNLSSFTWDHAVVYLEYETGEGAKKTEKHHIHNLKFLEESSLLSAKEFVLSERKRVLVVTEKGHSLEIPTHWKPVHDWSEAGA